MPFLATRPLFLKRCFFFLKGPPLSVPKKPRPVQEKKSNARHGAVLAGFWRGHGGFLRCPGGGRGGLGVVLGVWGRLLGVLGWSWERFGGLLGGLGVVSGVLEWFWGRLGVVLGVLQCLLDVVG